MYKLTNKIEKVKRYIIEPRLIYLIEGEIHDANGLILKVNLSYIDTLYYYKDAILITDDYGIPYSVEKDGLNKLFDDGKSILKIENKVIIYYDGDEIGIIEENKEKLPIDNFVGIHYANKHYAISSFKLNVNIYDIVRNRYLEFNLTELGKSPYADEDKYDEVYKILGVAHGNLWVFTQCGRLVAIDVETGIVVKKFANSPNDKELGYEIIEGTGDLYLNEQDDNLYGMSHACITKINTLANQIEERFNYNEYDKEGIGKYNGVYSPLLQGDYFTFLGAVDDRYSGIRFVGLYDYKKRKLVWEQEVIKPEEKVAGNDLIRPEPMRMSGNKLYVKDFKDTLHIFER